MIPLTLSGSELKVDDVVAVAHDRTVALDPAAIPKIEQSRTTLSPHIEQIRQLVADDSIKRTVEETLKPAP